MISSSRHIAHRLSKSNKKQNSCEKLLTEAPHISVEIGQQFKIQLIAFYAMSCILNKCGDSYIPNDTLFCIESVDK